MAYVIGQSCIGVKDTACIDACPTDCIHAIEGSNQYFIDPATCIDCGACEPACPVKAIFPGDQVPEDQKKFIAINADFFKGFDKSKSTAYTRQQKGDAKPAAAPGAPVAAAADAAAQDASWTEVEGWQAAWESHKNETEDMVERQKRYGRVRAIYEQADRYILRFYLPEKTPNHPFLYKFGLPAEMSSYEVTAELKGQLLKVSGKIKDRRIAKLSGHVNSFPDRFYFEHTFPKPVASVSVVPQGKHAVDVVAVKAAPQAEAA